MKGAACRFAGPGFRRRRKAGRQAAENEAVRAGMPRHVSGHPQKENAVQFRGPPASFLLRERLRTELRIELEDAAGRRAASASD